MLDLILKVLALIAPWRNQTTGQRVGTVCTLVTLLAGFVAYFATMPLPPVVNLPDVPVQYPTQDVVPNPPVDVPDVPVEAGAPVEPTPVQDAVIIGAVGMFCPVCLVAGVTVGCGPSWSKYRHDMGNIGVSLGACLADCGVKGAVDSAGEYIDVGTVDGGGITSALAACAVGCATRAGLAAVTTTIAEVGSHVGGVSMVKAGEGPKMPAPIGDTPRYRVKIALPGK